MANRLALRYVLYGRFGIDLIASMPLELVAVIFSTTDSGNLKFLSMLKLVRLLRLGRMITFLKANQKLKFSMKIGQLVFFVLLINHWINCLWYVVTEEDKSWFPPKDLDLRETDAYSAEPFTQYILFYYYAILLLVGNEILPTDNIELVVITFLTLIGTIFIGIVIGEFASILQAISKKERLVSEENDIINNLMLGLRIPEHIQNRVLEFHDNLSESQLFVKNDIYELISTPLELVIKSFQTYKTLSKLEFLNSKDHRQIEYFSRHLQIWYANCLILDIFKKAILLSNRTLPTNTFTTCMTDLLK